MIKMFTPLSVQLCLTGEKMNHRIEKSEAFQVVCKRKRGIILKVVMLHQTLRPCGKLVYMLYLQVKEKCWMLFYKVAYMNMRKA